MHWLRARTSPAEDARKSAVGVRTDGTNPEAWRCQSWEVTWAAKSRMNGEENM